MPSGLVTAYLRLGERRRSAQSLSFSHSLCFPMSATLDIAFRPKTLLGMARPTLCRNFRQLLALGFTDAPKWTIATHFLGAMHLHVSRLVAAAPGFAAAGDHLVHTVPNADVRRGMPDDCRRHDRERRCRIDRGRVRPALGEISRPRRRGDEHATQRHGERP